MYVPNMKLRFNINTCVMTDPTENICTILYFAIMVLITKYGSKK